MKKGSITSVLCIFIAMFLVTPVASVAEDTPPRLAEIWIIDLKEGYGFFKAFKEHVDFRSENDDPWDWQVYTPLLGNDLHRVVVRHCCFKWADVDDYREWIETNNVNEHFREHVAPHAKKYEHYFEEIDWDNSHWRDENVPYDLYEIIRFRIKAGHEAVFATVKKKISQIALNQGWAKDHVWVWASTIGGEHQEGLVIPRKNFASIDSSDKSFFEFLSEQVGSAEIAGGLMQQLSGATSGSDYQIWEYHGEVSTTSGGD